MDSRHSCHHAGRWFTSASSGTGAWRSRFGRSPGQGALWDNLGPGNSSDQVSVHIYVFLFCVRRLPESQLRRCSPRSVVFEYAEDPHLLREAISGFSAVARVASAHRLGGVIDHQARLKLTD